MCLVVWRRGGAGEKGRGEEGMERKCAQDCAWGSLHALFTMLWRGLEKVDQGDGFFEF